MIYKEVYNSYIRHKASLYLRILKDILKLYIKKKIGNVHPKDTPKRP